MTSETTLEIESELQRRLDYNGRVSRISTRAGDIEVSKQIKRVVCADGFSVSVQASQTHYCKPRTNYGPWYSVELGFPSTADEALIPFAETPGNPTDTVYGYVPIRIVAEVIALHGGFGTAT